MEVHWTHFDDLPERERTIADRRLAKLANGHDDLLRVRLVARGTRHHRHGGNEVRVTCSARGQELVAVSEREELGLALDEALGDLERQVHRLREKRRDRRTERPALPPHLGVVDTVFADDGYGFVLTDAGDRVYFHRNAVSGGLDFDRLEEGQRVGLNVEAGEKGLQATALVAPPPDVPSP